MANVRNFNARNYNPSNEAHEDGRCDPDVEARLYAEIYYSNETYPDYNVNSSNINSIPGPSNQIPSLLSLDPSNSNQHEGRRNMRDQFHWPVDTRPGQNYNSTNQLITRDTTVVSNIEPTVEPYSKATGMFRKPYRALTDGGFNPPHGYPQPLISPHELLPRFPRRNNDRFKHDEKSSRTPRQQINPANRSYLRLENPKSDRWRTQHAEKFQKQKELNRIERKEKQSKKLNSLNRNARSKRQRTERNLRSDFVEGHVSDEEVGRISFTPLNELIELSPEESNQNSPESSPTVATEPTIIHEVPENSTNTEVSAERTIMETETPEKSQETRVEITETTSTQNVEDILNSRNSKYNTIEKSTKRNEPIAEDDLSESDESIFEVPVPPKPTPPLIDLPDSDDDNEDSSSDEEDSPVVMTGKSPNQTANQNTIDFTSEDSSRNNSPDSVSADELNAQVEEINSPESEIPVNIVLNCTQLQKGVSSLEEIRQMREPSSANNLHDDEDSMTESEAMNWVSVDVEMVNQKEAQRRDKPGTDDEHWQNFETPVTSLERLRNSTQSSNVVIAEEVPSTSQEENTVHIPENQLTPVEIPRSVADEIGVEMTTENISNQVSLTLPTDQMGPPTIPLEKRKRPHVSENDPEPDVSDKRPEKRHKQIENTRANMSFEEYIFEPMPKQLVTFYNRPQKEFIYEISEIQSRMPRDPARWAILDVDMMGSKRRGNRKTCAFCHKEGHRREQCMDRPKTIVCKMCGKYGHNEPRCPSTMCLTCGRKFSSYRKTCEYCNRLKCSTCGGTGHDKSGCPDLWRKYHLTTSGTNPRVPRDLNSIEKSPRNLSCCNCARRGHDFASCSAYRWSGHFVTPSYVTNYEKGPCYIPERQPIQNRPMGIAATLPLTSVVTPEIPSLPQDISRLRVPATNLPENSIRLPEISTRSLENPITLAADSYVCSEVSAKSLDIVTKLREIAAHPQTVLSQLKEMVANNPEVNSDQNLVPIAEKVVHAIHSLIEQPQEIENLLQKPDEKVIFHYRTSRPSSTWINTTIIPESHGIEYPYYRGIPAVPQFLKNHILCGTVPLEVVVKEFSNIQGKVEIDLSSPDESSLVPLEILIIQWMSRSRADREIHCNAPALPFHKEQLFQVMIEKLKHFGKKTVGDGHKQVLNLKVLCSQAKQYAFSTKNVPQTTAVIKPLKKMYNKIEKAKEILVACVYNYSLDPNGPRLIKELKNLLDELKVKSNSTEPKPALFLSILWYYFELFIGHNSPYIRSAASAWCERAEEIKNRPITGRKKRKLRLFPIIPSNGELMTNREKRLLRKEMKKKAEQEKKLNQSISEPEKIPNTELATEPKKKKKKKSKSKTSKEEQPVVEIIEIDDDIQLQPNSTPSKAQSSNSDANNIEPQCSSTNVDDNEDPIHTITLSKNEITTTPDMTENPPKITKHKKYGGVNVIIKNIPSELPRKSDKRIMSCPHILKLALASADYVRENNLPAMEKSTRQLVERAKLLTATTEQVRNVWSRIIIAMKMKLSAGKAPGTIVNYPDDC